VIISVPVLGWRFCEGKGGAGGAPFGSPLIFSRRFHLPCLGGLVPQLGIDHFTKTFVSQHVVWIHSFEPMMRNGMQRNKIAELVLGAPRETAEMAKPQSWT
jgi:hypothetical protein